MKCLYVFMLQVANITNKAHDGNVQVCVYNAQRAEGEELGVTQLLDPRCPGPAPSGSKWAPCGLKGLILLPQ